MTQEYPAKSMTPAPLTDSPPPGQGTGAMVRDQAAELSQGTVQAGKHAADTAREQVLNVTAEATRQGRDLVRQAQDQLEEQAASGQQRVADTLRSLSDQLSEMADSSSRGGIATDLARQVAGRVSDAAYWLSSRQPAQVVDEVQSFARRRPGTYLILAAGAGLIAGRLTRAMKAASSEDQEPATPEASPWAQDPAEAAYPAGTASGAAADLAGPAGGSPAASEVTVTSSEWTDGDRTSEADSRDLP